MPMSPLCQVSEGGAGGPWQPTTNGVDVLPGSTVLIRLNDPAWDGNWFLRIIGTDELSSPPTLDGVNPINNQVLNKEASVTLVFPVGDGRALGLQSEVTGNGGPIVTTFGIYSLTPFNTRVGFVTETREGDTNHGWATKLNPLIRSGGGGGGGGGGPDNYTLTLVTEEKIIPEGQAMLFQDDVVIEDGGDLIVLGAITPTRTEDNFSMLHVPMRSERVVQQNDEMLFTEDLEVDGQLTVDGQITDATPYDGDDILAALTAIAPTTPLIIGAAPASPVSFLSAAEARAVMDVPSVAEMNAAVGPSTVTVDPVVHHSSFPALRNHLHYVWSGDGSGKTIALPTQPVDGDRVEIVGLSNGTDLVTIDNGPNQIFYSAQAAPPSGPAFVFPSAGMHLSLVFRDNAATGFGAAWFNTSNSVTAQFGKTSSPIMNGVIVSASSGQIRVEQLADNSVLGRATTGAVSQSLQPGHLLFRPSGGSLGSYSPSTLNSWTVTLVGPGPHVLAIDKINKYVASSAIVLQFPAAQDGDEVQIKEASPFGGTAPGLVTMDTGNPLVAVESTGLGGFTQTTTLSEYKTWMKYKFDGSGPVWRIVGAAYQLP